MSPARWSLLPLALLAACTTPPVVAADATPDTTSDTTPVTADIDRFEAIDAAPFDEDAALPPLDLTTVPDTGSCTSNRDCPSGTCFRERCVCFGIVCDGQCFRYDDARHCGRCGNECTAPRAACRDGACACPQDTCGGACVDIRSDDANCGACGQRCDARSRCDFGTCACLEGFGRCGGATECETSTRDNPLHCGGCDYRCFDGERCEASRCVRSTCAPGRGDCVASVAGCETDLDRSDRHCGACDRACGSGTRCVSGRCVSAAVTMRMPASALRVTSARPWFRWRLGAGVDGVRLQVCADRECARTELDVAVTGEQFRPAAPLALGTHFWRTFAQRGGSRDTEAGPVWWFRVSAEGDYDEVIDLNGDGVGDTVSWQDVPGRDYGFRVQYGAAAGGVRRADDLLTTASSTTPLESFPGGASPAGDIDGDGVGDMAVILPYNQRISEVESNGAIRMMVFLGSRSGEPMPFSSVDLVNRHHPGPTVYALTPCGNAPGFAGCLLSAGNPALCEGYRFTHTGFQSGPICGLVSMTAGDYNADGQVDIVTDGLVTAGHDLPTDPIGGCVAGWSFDPSDSARYVRTQDVDVDGYDDLVVTTRSVTAPRVTYGGPRGLDGSRCSTSP